MITLTFYEQAGIIVPGSSFLLGLMFYFPAFLECHFPGLSYFLGKDGVTTGGLGALLIISYVAGQILAALGTGIEIILYWINKGYPSNWIIPPTERPRWVWADWLVSRKPVLLSDNQITMVNDNLKERLNINLPSFMDCDEREDWYPIFRQIYSDVEQHGKSGRSDIFNGIYGLNKGLCVAAFLLMIIVLIHDFRDFPDYLPLLAMSMVFLYHMRHFSVHYAREILIQFILLSPDSGKSPVELDVLVVEAPADAEDA